MYGDAHNNKVFYSIMSWPHRDVTLNMDIEGKERYIDIKISMSPVCVVLCCLSKVHFYILPLKPVI